MKVLSVLRDVVVILGVLLIAYLALEARSTRERERTIRLSQVQQAIDRLDTAYKANVFDSSENKGIYQQIFRQNEIALEYQKLTLVRDLIPLDAALAPAASSNIPPPPQ